MSQALIKGLVDKNGEQFVAYFLPNEDTLKKQHRDVENEVDYDADDEYDFKLAREYTWNIKSKVNSGYEENYYFIMKEDAVYYNELETRVRLSKRRTKLGKIANTKLVVKYRDFTRQETKNQRVRGKDLELVDENAEESEESEEEEEDVDAENSENNEGSSNEEGGGEGEEERDGSEEGGEQEEEEGEEEEANVEQASDEEAENNEGSEAAQSSVEESD
jgi:RNA polymerase II-associated factor 1